MRSWQFLTCSVAVVGLSGQAFAQEPEVEFQGKPLVEHVPPKMPSQATTDERVLLYLTSIYMGYQTGYWVSTGFGTTENAKALGFGLLSGLGSLNVVAVIDTLAGFRYGQAHAVSTGLYLGYLQQFYLFKYLKAKKSIDTYPFILASGGSNEFRGSTTNQVGIYKDSSLLTVFWLMPTLNATAGAILGTTELTTPGRAAWVGSTGMWLSVGLGAMFGLGESNNLSHQATGSLAALVGIDVGAVAGMLSGPRFSPSVSRTRLIDLTTFGIVYLSGRIAYAANPDNQATLSRTLGIATPAGFALGLLLTSHMDPERRPVVPNRSNPIASWQPTMVPTRDGFQIGVGGQLF
jgi:hypothetical protein